MVAILGALIWYNNSKTNANKNPYLTAEQQRDVDACDAKGGKIYGSAEGEVVCALPYADAGKECTSSDQCEGDCVTHKLSDLGIKGTCQINTFGNNGCETAIEKEYLQYWMGDAGYRCTAENWQSVCDSKCIK